MSLPPVSPTGQLTPYTTSSINDGRSNAAVMNKKNIEWQEKRYSDSQLFIRRSSFRILHFLYDSYWQNRGA
jgi:hypothetical protein